MPPLQLLRKPNPYVPPSHEVFHLLIYCLGVPGRLNSTDAKEDEPLRSSSLLAKLLAPFKSVERNVRAPKSPKKEKKEEIKVLF